MYLADNAKWNQTITAKSTTGRKHPLAFLNKYANAVLDAETGKLMEYQHLINTPKYREIWDKSFENKIGRLAQGMPGRVKGSNTIFFIDKGGIPKDRWTDVTYGRIVCDIREQKVENTEPD